MNQQREEMILDLLEKRAVYGLTEVERRQLDELGGGEDLSLEFTAAAIGLAGLGDLEELPENLRARIMAEAKEHFADRPSTVRQVEFSRPSVWSWLGWAVAAVAIAALIFNIWWTRPTTPQVAGPGPTSTPTPERITPEQRRQQLITASTDLARANIGGGNLSEIKPTGDVVWSDTKQTGFVRIAGLPKNDPQKQTYQLWIFDESQDPKTPVSGGTFNVAADGEIVVPIDPSLKVRNPKAFAISIEKPGGVMVTDQKRIAALAKRET
jgi:anti-sigma-K factor RskA